MVCVREFMACISGTCLYDVGAHVCTCPLKSETVAVCPDVGTMSDTLGNLTTLSTRTTLHGQQAGAHCELNTPMYTQKGCWCVPWAAVGSACVIAQVVVMWHGHVERQ